MPVYIADFETTTQKSVEKEGQTRVWLWGLHDKDNDKFIYGKTIKSFFREIKKLPTSSKIYFHNLRFDGEFMMYYLFRNGFKHSKEKKLNDKEFSTLITHMNVVYAYKVRIGKKQFTFWDSAKLIPLSVKKIGKAFNTPVLKGDIDYHMYRPIGYTPTEEEIEYVKNDCLIVSNALDYFFEKNLKKMTIASNAMANYKKLIGEKNFDRWYPILKSHDEFLRASYKGGFTYANPKFQGQDISKGIVFDVNSLYPYVMYTKLLPFGEPIYYEGKHDGDSLYPLYVQQIECSFRVKENHIPTLQLKGDLRFPATEYLRDSNGLVVPITLTNVDLELFFKHYDVTNLSYVGGWKFRGSKQLFKKYIDFWSQVKEQATVDKNDGLRQIAKLMLNSLYGKFGTSPMRRQKHPVYDKESDTLSYENGNAEKDKPIFVALASFVTSYARNITITSAQENYERFLYADTDSLHLIGTDFPENLNVHPTELGAWDNEATFVRARFLRAKTYGEELFLTNEEYLKLNEEKKKGWCYKKEHDGWTQEHFTVAGLSDKSHLNFENFVIGSEVQGRRQQTRVKGGKLIEDKTFKIKGLTKKSKSGKIKGSSKRH